MPDDLRITITDVTKAGYCGRGARRWFEAYGLDEQFRTLVKGGSMPAEELLATGDAAALRVVEAKVRREWLDGDPSSIIITADDLRESEKCMAGARAFGAKHGLDWQTFLDKGITAKELLALGDHDALRMLRQKMERGSG